MVVAQRRIGIKGRFRKREKMHLRDKFDPTSNDPKYAAHLSHFHRWVECEKGNRNYKAVELNPLILISTLWLVIRCFNTCCQKILPFYCGFSYSLTLSVSVAVKSPAVYICTRGTLLSLSREKLQFFPATSYVFSVHLVKNASNQH